MKKALKANSTTARPRIMLDPGRADAIVVHSGLPAPDASRVDGPPTRARRKDVDRAVKQLRHEATRRPRNAWIARITENAPVTPRTLRVQMNSRAPLFSRH